MTPPAIQIPLDVLGAPPPYAPPSPDTPPSYSPFPSMTFLNPSIFNTIDCPGPFSTGHEICNPHLQDALREFRASQDPQNWGKRSLYPGRSQRELTELEAESGWRGWVSYLLGLLTPELPGGRSMPLSAAFYPMSPYGI